jgi:hypothetical protein
MVTPLFDEKRCAHRALVTCARALAAAGAAVAIPDLTGTGNSGGSVSEVTIAQWEADLHAAVAAFDSAEAPLVVVACRAGALLASQVLGATCARLVLLQPAVAGRSYLQQARLRRKMQDEITGGPGAAAGATEVEGEVLSPDLFAALQGLRLPEAAPCADVRLVQCGPTEKLQAEYARLAATWGDAHVQTRAVVRPPFWQAHSPGDYADVAAAVVAEALG